MKRALIAALAGAMLAPCAVAAGEPDRPGCRCRALLTLEGRIAAVEVAAEAGGPEWITAVLKPDGELPDARIRVAPREVLDRLEFPIAAGRRVKVRVFSDETPYLAQQIRDQKTGRIARLRSLRGEPLWDFGCYHHGRGPGHGRHRHGRPPDRGRPGF